MSQPNPPVRRKKSVVLDGAVATTILVVVLSLMSRSGSLLALFALGWLIYGLGVFIRRFGKAGAAIVVAAIVSLSTWVYLEIRAGLPKRLLLAEIYKTGASSVHTDGPEWAPESRFVLFDERIGDEEVLRFTLQSGLLDLRKIHFGGSRITDKSLAGLARLTQVTSMTFKNTQVTFGGLELLQGQLPKCEVLAEWPESESQTTEE